MIRNAVKIVISLQYEFVNTVILSNLRQTSNKLDAPNRIGFFKPYSGGSTYKSMFFNGLRSELDVYRALMNMVKSACYFRFDSLAYSVAFF